MSKEGSFCVSSLSILFYGHGYVGWFKCPWTLLVFMDRDCVNFRAPD